jgi:hypothetical protein
MAFNGNCCTPACGGCDDGTGTQAPPPATMQAVFSGITLCTGCQKIGFFSFNDFKLTNTPDPNQTYCLTLNDTESGFTNTATICLWEYIITSNPVILTEYSSGDGSCSGTVLGTYPIDKIQVVAARVPTGPGAPIYQFYVRWAASNPYTQGFGASVYANMFEYYTSSASPFATCAGGSGINSDQTTCLGLSPSFFSTVAWATGGTVTIIPNGC